MRLFSDDSLLVSDPLLRRAFVLAERGRGTTAPNPMVGCVIARDGDVLGEGWHVRAGEPHAEVIALRAAGADVRAATTYVTLEPCAHQGRTPPCVDALVAAGISRVVVGMADPSTVAGGGADRLRDAGVDVVFAEDTAPFERLNRGWLAVVHTGRPWVTVKVAVSLDGRIALRQGTRSQITGAGSAEITMRLRAAHDAVLVGAGTARVDDPQLTVRDADGGPADRQPLRVVLASSDTTEIARCTCFSDGLGPATLLIPEDGAAPGQTGVTDTTAYPADEGLAGAFRVLCGRGVNSVLVEAGPRLFAALWDAGMIDELVMVHAGGVAGDDAPGAYAGALVHDVPVLPRKMRAEEVGICGDEAVTVWHPRVAGTTDVTKGRGQRRCSPVL